MFVLLTTAGGFCWALCYVLILRIGFREKTYGMPLLALCFNLAWEFVFSFVYPHNKPQVFVNIGWFLLDTVLFYQTVRFWKNEFSGLVWWQFYFGLLVGLGLAMTVVLLCQQRYQDFGFRSAFGSNLLMSLLFIFMLWQRKSPRGQSVYIAAAKMLGTGFTYLAFRHLGQYAREGFPMDFVCAAIFILDGIYFAGIYRWCKNTGMNPWQRI